ncbi:MAG: hypothetical protein E7Z63_01045 [Thermoplasmata archaeon]|nr:hypothetical protein [Thermoplasmata archaeon]
MIHRPKDTPLCPKCGGRLARETDRNLRKEYPWVCPNCDENYYDVEVDNGPLKGSDYFFAGLEIMEEVHGQRFFDDALIDSVLTGCPDGATFTIGQDAVSELFTDPSGWTDAENNKNRILGDLEILRNAMIGAGTDLINGRFLFDTVESELDIDWLSRRLAIVAQGAMQYLRSIDKTTSKSKERRTRRA